MKILLIDDDSSLCELVKLKLAANLDENKYELKVLYSEEGVYELAESFRPDVFLIDLQLPKKDGYIISATLRTNALFENSTLIAISAKEDTFDHKFDYFLAKPIEFEKLFEILNQISK